MATKPSVKLYLSLGGQQEFRTRLQACQREVKTFQTELKTLETRYDGNRNHVDALTERQKVLEKEYEALQRKQKAATDGLEESSQDYEKCSKNLENLKEKLEMATKEHEQLRESVSGIDDYKKLTQTIESQEDSLDQYKKALNGAKDNLAKLTAEGKEGTEEWKAQQKSVAELEKAVDSLSDELEENKSKQKSLYEANKDALKLYDDQEAQIKKIELAVEKEGSQVAECERRMANWNLEIAKTDKQIESVDSELQKNRQYLEEAKNSYDHCATSIDGMGKEVNDTKTDLEGMQSSVDGVNKELDELNSASSLEGLGKSIVNYQAMLNIVLDALRQIPQLIGQGMEFVIDVGSSFESQMSKVSAISGASGADFEALTQKAAEMGRTTKFTATQAGEALEYMAMAGWKTDDMLNGLEGIMSLAAASGEDLGTTSDIVTDALTAFGLTAKDATHFADMMAAASSNANTNVSMMGETFKYAAPVAGALGFTAEDTSIAIGLMANAGIKASTAGTALRSGLTNLVKPTSTMAAYMDRYGVSITDASGNMRTMRELMLHLRDTLGGLSADEQAAAAAAIFGKNAMSGWLAVINASDEDFDKLAAAIDNCDGSASAMSDTMINNLSGALTIFNSAVEGLGIAVYNKVSGPLTDIVQMGTDVVSAITGWIEPAQSELEQYISGIQNANARVKTELDAIMADYDQSMQEIAELDSYKGLFEDVLASGESLSNLSISDMVSAMVSDMGHLHEDGTTVIDEDFLNVVAHIGNLKESDIMGGQLEKDIDATGEGLDDIKDKDLTSGELATSTEGLVEKIGGVAVEAGTSKEEIDKLLAPVRKEETFWLVLDDIDGQWKALTEDERVAALAVGEFLDATMIQGDQGFVETLDQIGTGLENVVLITDDFKKKRITAAIEQIAKLKPEAKDLWNEQYGILSNNLDLINDIINLEEAYLASQAFNKARSAIYEKQGKAYMNLYQAESAAKNVLEEINKTAESINLEPFATLEEFLEYYPIIAEEDIGKFSGLMQSAENAGAEIDKANASIKSADESLVQINEAYDYMLEKTGQTQEQVDGFTESVENNTTSLDKATQGLDALGDEEEEVTEETVELNKAMTDASEEGLKNQKKAVEELSKEFQKLRDEISKTLSDKASFDEAWTYGALGEEEEAPDLNKMAETLRGNIGQLQNWKSDIQRLSGEVGNSISEEFFEYLLEQGPDYGAVLREIVSDLDQGGSTTRNLSAAYTSALGQESQMTDYFSTLKFNLQNQLNEVAEGLNYSEFWDAVNNGLSGGEAWQKMSDEVAAKLEEALSAAMTIGAGIPEKLAEGIKEGEISPEQAISVINGTILDRLNALVSLANENGIAIPAEVAAGIKSGDVDVFEAFNTIVDGFNDKSGLSTQSRAVGHYILGEVKEGIEEGDIVQELDKDGNPINRTVDKLAEGADATQVGEKMIDTTAEGMKSSSGTAESAAEETVGNAETKAEKKAEDFKKTGEKSADKIAEGIEGKESTITKAIDTVMDAALKEVDSYDNKLKQAGNDIPGLIGSGATEKTRDLEAKMEELMKAASAKVEASYADMTAKGKGIPGAIGSGVSASQGDLVTPLNNALAYARYNLDLSGWDGVGIQIDNGIINGMNAGSNNVSITAQNVAVTALNSAKAALGIQSPSKRFKEEVGVMIPKGIVQGVEDAAPEISDALELALTDSLAGAEKFVQGYKLDTPLSLDFVQGDANQLPIAPAETEPIKLTATPASSSSTDLGTTALDTYESTTSLEGAITENTKALERLVKCATLMLNAAKTMSEKVGVTIINEIDGTQFDSRIKSVSQKAINQRTKQLAYAGGR